MKKEIRKLPNDLDELIKQEKNLKEIICYETGGKLLVYQDNNVDYVPSKNYINHRKKHYEELYRYKNNPRPISFERIREYNRKKLLFTRQESPIVNRFLNKILKMHEVFDFTRTK